jgi:hypothetical protein
MTLKLKGNVIGRAKNVGAGERVVVYCLPFTTLKICPPHTTAHIHTHTHIHTQMHNQTRLEKCSVKNTSSAKVARRKEFGKIGK